MTVTYFGASQALNTHPALSAPAASGRWGTCDIRGLRQPAALVLNPHAGRKLGLDTNTHGRDEVQAALTDV